jgi:polyhydroxyalkanoate synthesis repressor PhaR
MRHPSGMLQRVIFALAIVQCGAQVLAREPAQQPAKGAGVSGGVHSLSEEKPATENAVVIKKYANRRLYNTATSTYVTLDDLSSMVKAGTNFLVYDAKTGEDITRSVLTQIIFEEENKGTNLLPINFLRQLIRFYGDSMQAFVPGFLEFSLDNLGKEQDKFRAQLMESWGTDPLKAMQDVTQRNMAMFGDAMRVFNPFAAMGMPDAPGATPGSASKPAAAAQPASQPAAAAGKDDLQTLKDQLSAMQQKLDTIARK